jgi:hypothetical protein
VTITPQTKNWLRQSAALDGAVVSQTLLNLLERVEALEQKYETQRLAQPPAAQPTQPPAPAGGLVERVAHFIGDPDSPAELWFDDARAAIREVAAWMRENKVGYDAVRWLVQEAGR